jgi:site-specific DNA recombinase
LNITAALATKRIATYERVSSEDQRNRETIKTQTDEIARRLASTPGIALVGRYADDGVSGTIPIAERPAGARLLADAARGLFDEVWVYSVDRLGRGWIDPEIVWETLESAGVTIYSVREEVGDRLVYHIMAGLAAKKRTDFLRLSSDGMNRAAKEGRYCGGIRPFGYLVEGKRPQSYLMPAEEPILGSLLSEAEAVRLMYRRLAVDGKSCQGIADELNALGIPTLYALEAGACGANGPRDSGARAGSGTWW